MKSLIWLRDRRVGGTLTVVLDRNDDIDVLARLRRLHARPFGQIVCEPAPGGGSGGLARSLLAAHSMTTAVSGRKVAGLGPRGQGLTGRGSGSGAFLEPLL